MSLQVKPFFRPETGMFLGLWLALLLVGRSSLLQDPGTFWHTSLGLEMLETGEIPRTDHFTFTRGGTQWLTLQWLAELFLGAAYALGGWDSVVLLTVTVIAATYTFAGSRLLRSGLHWMPATLVLVFLLLASSHHFHARPHLATIGLLAVTVGLLMDFENQRGGVGRLGWLLLLFPLWTNLHGGVLAGLATVYFVVAGWAAAYVIRRGNSCLLPRHVGPVGVLMVLLPATFLCNPYGAAMRQRWLEIMAMPLPNIIEEHRPLDFSESMAWIVIGFALVYTAVIATTRPRDWKVTWLVPLLWLLLAWSRIRHVPLFAMVTTLVLADALPSSRIGCWLARRDLFRMAPGLPSTWRAALIPASVVVLTLLLQRGQVPIPVFGTGWARHAAEKWPVELTNSAVPQFGNQFDRHQRPAVRVFNTLTYGGFLAFHFPHVKTFIDDRCELFGAEFLERYVEMEQHHPEKIEGCARQYAIDYALVKRDSKLDRYLQASDGWSTVATAQAARLYRKNS